MLGAKSKSRTYWQDSVAPGIRSMRHFEGEVDIDLVKHLEDRFPAIGEVLEACIDLTWHYRGKRIEG